MRLDKEMTLGMAAVVSSIAALTILSLHAFRQVTIAASYDLKAAGWAVALLGLIAVALSLFVWLRFLRRIISPLREIQDVIEAWQQGEDKRRVHLREAPSDLEAVARQLNDVFDSKMNR